MNTASLSKVDLHWPEAGNFQGRSIVFANPLGTDFPGAAEATIKLLPDAHCQVTTGAGHLPCVKKAAEYAALPCRFIKETSHD